VAAIAIGVMIGVAVHFLLKPWERSVRQTPRAFSLSSILAVSA
jgi:hypothetical protein